MSTDVARFVRQHIKSVWSLELLLMMRNRPDHTWTVVELVAELRASTGLVVDNLLALARSGLVVDEGNGHYRYGPAGEPMKRMADEIAAAYRERPVAVINLIAAPEDPVQGLADAFKFKGNDR